MSYDHGSPPQQYLTPPILLASGRTTSSTRNGSTYAHPSMNCANRPCTTSTNHTNLALISSPQLLSTSLSLKDGSQHRYHGYAKLHATKTPRSTRYSLGRPTSSPYVLPHKGSLPSQSVKPSSLLNVTSKHLTSQLGHAQSYCSYAHARFGTTSQRYSVSHHSHHRLKILTKQGSPHVTT